MHQPDGSVTVLDKDQRFLEYTHPAVARKLLKDGAAIVWSREPFAIKLLRSVPQPSYQRRIQMAFNWIEFFKEEKDVYIQNISGMRISMMFDDGRGHGMAYSFEPSSRPVQLTQYIPFDAIKRSVDFRKLVSRRPPMLTVLTETEYKNYYSEMARSAGMFTKDEKGKRVPDIEAALDKVEADRRAYLSREPLADAKEAEPIHDVEEDDKGRKVARSNAPVSEEDLIHPKVIHLCNQVKTEVPENEKMPANELILELKGLTAVLKLDDWEYVRAHGWYASVKKLAKQQLEKLASSDEGAED